MLYGNMTLFGVVSDLLHPVDSGDPSPPQHIVTLPYIYSGNLI